MHPAASPSWTVITNAEDKRMPHSSNLVTGGEGSVGRALLAFVKRNNENQDRNWVRNSVTTT